MMPAFQRNGVPVGDAEADDPSAFDALKATMEGDPRLDLKAERERDYYEGQSSTTTTLIRVLATFVTAILSIGAVFGAMNTMYAAVAYRTREIGTLRALGFSRSKIISAFLAESVALALVGGVIGCVLALPVHGLSTRRENMQSFSELAFKFRITPELLAGGPRLLRAYGGPSAACSRLCARPVFRRPCAPRDLNSASKHRAGQHLLARPSLRAPRLRRAVPLGLHCALGGRRIFSAPWPHARVPPLLRASRLQDEPPRAVRLDLHRHGRHAEMGRSGGRGITSITTSSPIATGIRTARW
jgi:hypothetical protein